VRYQEILEACWTGYQQQGMKKKGNRQVPNCVPVAEVKIGPEMSGKELLYKAAAQAMLAASQEGISLDYEQAIRQASKIYGIPYQPSELPRLLAQRAEIDRQLALLKQGKQVAKQRRQAKLAPTPADAEEYWKTHALPTDRIKPPTRTLEAVDPLLDNYARDLLGLVIIAGGAFAVGTYYTIRNKLKKYQGSRIIDALERKGVTMNRTTYQQVKPLLDQFRQALQNDEGEQAKELAKRIEQMIVMGKLSAPEPQAVDTALATKEKELAEDLKKWFKEKWVRFGPDGKIRGDCARGSSGEGKPKCLPQAKAQALGKKGRASSAAKKRREDPNANRRGAAKNVATRVQETVVDVKLGLAEIYRRLAPQIERYRDSFLAGQLYDELENYAELHGAEKEFKQMMNGARNRAHIDYDTNPGGFQNWFWYLPFADEDITEESQDDRNARIIAGEIEDAMSQGKEELAKQKIKELIRVGYTLDKDGRLQRMGMYEEAELQEKQDACYRKVKSRYKVWPSAYASGALVQCRKKGAANWGNKGKK
jgi:hypothetical protein